jgi:uncharacterized protein (TIGR00369 family)
MALRTVGWLKLVTGIDTLECGERQALSDRGAAMGNANHPEPAAPEVQARIRDAFERQPLMQLLGASLALIAVGRVNVVLPRRPQILQQHGFIHAGATCTIANCAGEYAALTLTDPHQAELLGIEHKINFLTAAKGDRLEAIGTVMKSGRTLCVCSFEVWGVEGSQRSLVAAGQQTLIRIEPRTAT